MQSGILHLLISTLLINQVVGLQCWTDSLLKKYNLEHIIHYKEELSTPPSITTTEWFINICDSDRAGMPTECNEDDIICGLEWVKLPDSEPVLTKLIHIGNNEYDSGYADYGRLKLHLKAVKWGREDFKVHLHFECDLQEDEDHIYMYRYGYDGVYGVSIVGPSGCVKEQYDYNHANDRYYYPRRGLPWFVWVIIAIAIFIGVFLILILVLYWTGWTFWEFCAGTFRLLKAIVIGFFTLIGDIYSKVFSRDSNKTLDININRDGYSAL